MLNTLYNLSPSFRTWVQKKAFDQQSKPKGFEGMSHVFTDSNGKRYYKYLDDLDIPIAREGKLRDSLGELERKLNRKELGLFCDAINRNIYNAIRAHSLEAATKELAKVSVLTEEIQFREDVVIHPEIFFDIAATLYISEDENPAVYDLDIHLQKVEQFKKDSAGGLRDFFYESSLKAYLPYLELSNSDLAQLFHLMETRIQSKLVSISQL